MNADTPNMKKPAESNELPAGHADTGEFTLAVVKTEPRADSRLIAQRLGIQHKATAQLIERYVGQIKTFGLLPFQMEAVRSVGGRGAKRQRFYLLNEDQAIFLLTLSRNTPRVVALKATMVRAFAAARAAAQARQQDYLPAYHDLHNTLQSLGRDAAHQRHLHINVNRLLNRMAGIDAGQRPRAGLPVQSLLTVGQMLAARAAAGAQDDREAYARIKAALSPLAALPVVEVLQ